MCSLTLDALSQLLQLMELYGTVSSIISYNMPKRYVSDKIVRLSFFLSFDSSTPEKEWQQTAYNSEITKKSQST